jgi:hypothetical protein
MAPNAGVGPAEQSAGGRADSSAFETPVQPAMPACTRRPSPPGSGACSCGVQNLSCAQSVGTPRPATATTTPSPPGASEGLRNLAPSVVVLPVDKRTPTTSPHSPSRPALPPLGGRMHGGPIRESSNDTPTKLRRLRTGAHVRNRPDIMPTALVQARVGKTGAEPRPSGRAAPAAPPPWPRRPALLPQRPGRRPS